MSDIETGTHAFVVRIWREGGAWRGHVTHVPSGERRYFVELEKVLEFIATWLEAPGSGPGARRGG